ncbi:MAG: GUN4 domain-containing protein [Cyanobacteria bacterium P01_D01_bin.14]
MTFTSDPPPDPERRWVEQAMNAFVRWVPLGSGGGAFLHFLFQQDWALALAMFPVTVVTGIWAAYTEQFVARCREIASVRGRQDPDSIVHWLKLLDQVVRWQLSGFENKYRRCQANACRYYETEGLFTSYRPLLNDLYIPLEISSEYESESPARGQPNYIWDLLRHSQQNLAYRQTVIIARGGYGKTTLLRNVAYQYATRPRQLRWRQRLPKLVPFLLYLRKEWRSQVIAGFPDLVELILQYHIVDLPEGRTLQVPSHWIARLLRRGEALILFDGFDEVPEYQREKMAWWLSEQMERYPRSIFVLTSRPEGYEAFKRCLHAQRLTTVFVKDFNSQQREQFVHKWYLYQERRARMERNTPDIHDIAWRYADQLIQQIEQRSELSQMARNPLMLNMIAECHRRSPQVELPGRRTELYAAICRMLMSDRPREKAILMPLSETDSQAVLQRIALEMSIRHRVRLPLKILTKLAETAIQEEAVTETDPELARLFLAKTVEVSELMIDRETSQEYEFTHRSFQDYLAARQLQATRQDGEQILLSGLAEPWWRETLLLYAEMVSPTRLIEAACMRQTPEALDVAYRCWQISQTRQHIPDTVYAALQDRRYARLDSLLRQGDWQAADDETYRLMIRAVGKEENQFFLPADLQAIPKNDLQRLDRLWFAHSAGKFGFSVQMQCYVRDCGGIPNGEYDPAIWQDLCHRLGWMEDGNYRLYQQFVFSIEAAPVGHLPRRWDVFGSSSRRSLLILLGRSIWG